MKSSSKFINVNVKNVNTCHQHHMYHSIVAYYAKMQLKVDSGRVQIFITGHVINVLTKEETFWRSFILQDFKESKMCIYLKNHPCVDMLKSHICTLHILHLWMSHFLRTILSSSFSSWPVYHGWLGHIVQTVSQSRAPGVYILTGASFPVICFT